jgi:hypothetical protein
MPTMSRLRSIFFCLLVISASFHAFAFDDFKPVSSEELSMKDNPKQPGAHAMILEMTDAEDDTDANSYIYKRIKIFTEEGGKRYADVEIPYFKGDFSISDIKARTIHPDGKVIPFSGQVYDKVVVKSKTFKYQAKTFTMPDVQPGSIIEFKYRKGWEANTLYPTHWELQDELFIKKATFSIKPYRGDQFGFRYMGVGIQKGNEIKESRGTYTLNLNDVPAFETERYAPPERELKPRFELFYYEGTAENDKDKFWKKFAQDQYHEVEGFIGHRGAIQSAVAGMVAPNDSNEAKMRKIYAKVQQLQNLSFTREKTEQEAKREKLKDINNVEDVLKRGYGLHYHLNLLYVALARAAGLDATILDVSERNEVFFQKALLDKNQLNGEIVLVNSDGKQYFLDPGTPMCPFNQMPWKMTGVQALQFNKDGGTFIQTPNPLSDFAVTNRIADLKFEDGSLKGTIDVRFAKQEALTWRLSEITSDEAEFKTDLEEDMKRLLPGGSTVKLSSIDNLKDEEKPLDVHYNVEVLTNASVVGSRILLPMEIFQSNDRNPFVHEQRIWPLYFSYPYQEIDQVNIKMPPGLSVENLPQPKVNKSDFAYYDAKWTNSGDELLLVRRFAMLGFFMPKSIYPQVRTFFQEMSSTDQESVVMHAQKIASK